ncbi:neuronal acetylcholine receptor subunit alpha-7 [Rhipicephalus sanguineus]|uniref:neuronal acetylcholine receptor subunit alpha-7 n=1 Tax=Rhipicephalus sanguineus TaxID=34632 RepID=UPI0018931DEB|nr:neuronal acetylcholine receptor subunit alpha-7 [Rhipicephalus sanguineus]
MRPQSSAPNRTRQRRGALERRSHARRRRRRLRRRLALRRPRRRRDKSAQRSADERRRLEPGALLWSRAPRAASTLTCRGEDGGGGGTCCAQRRQHSSRRWPAAVLTPRSRAAAAACCFSAAASAGRGPQAHHSRRTTTRTMRPSNGGLPPLQLGFCADLLWIAVLLTAPQDSEQGPHERRLLADLLANYNTLERPVLNESEPLILNFGLTLQQIIDVDEKNQLIITNIWLTLEWIDVNLRWNPKEYGGVQDLCIPPNKIWKPDVLMYNSADEKFDATYPTNVVVRSNGSCKYMPPGIFKSTCKIDITWFPFDDQKCKLKFGSWTYHGYQLDLRVKSEEGGDLSSYIPNGEWDLIGVPGVRNVLEYACCPEPYIDITYTIHIRRRTLYYGFNLIIPCVLISSMTLLGFTLPPDTGERLTLGVTILLSMTVFMLQLAETMPPTSDAVSIIGTYFACIMIMVAFSVVMTVVVLNYHHRNQETTEMPALIRTVFLVWLPWLLRMEPPGQKVNRRSLFLNNKMKELELKERSSRSLLANVLDIDDDFRTANRAAASNCHGTRTPYLGGGGGGESTVHACVHSSRELNLILRELRFITSRMRKDEQEREVDGEWKFAAMVVDRVCLIIFSAFTITSTCACLFSAPHLVA